MRKVFMLAAVAVVLIVANVTIAQRESLLKEGKVVLLELAPADPRSLMQGDYMALRFKVANDAFGFGEVQRKDGHMVVQLDERGVGKFIRFADVAHAPGEVLLRYRVRESKPKFGTNAYFFQEGHAQDFAAARYGEFRVSGDGEMILVALRDADMKPL